MEGHVRHSEEHRHRHQCHFDSAFIRIVDETLDLDNRSLQPEMVVADGIHNPPKTRLIRAAEARGCRVVDGLTMLVNQGVIGIKYWTGIDADVSVMRKALENLM